jgi:hypothetical protein
MRLAAASVPAAATLPRVPTPLSPRNAEPELGLREC